MGQSLWARIISGSIRTCVPNLVAVRRSCRKEGVQTDTHTHKGTVCSIIVDGNAIWLWTSGQGLNVRLRFGSERAGLQTEYECMVVVVSN